MKKQILCFLICFILGMHASFAADFSAANSDGVTLYYSITNASSGSYEVGVTYGSTKYSGSVSVPDTVIYNGITYKVTRVLASAFKSCTGLTTCTLPNHILDIGDYAFSGCTGLTSITIPSSVKTIGTKTFSSCSAVTDIYLNADSCYCTYTASGPFHECTSLKTITIGDNVKAITYQMFRDCSTATTVKIGNSVSAIGDDAFISCTSLSSITIPSSVKSIGSGAFGNCTGLQEDLIIPNSVTSIGNYAFSSCSSLSKIKMSSSVKNIGNYAFSNCTGLKDTLTLTDSIIKIGDYAFQNCSGLSYTSLGNSIDSIGFYSFSGLTGITTLTIPASLKYIKSGAFQNCTGLTTVTYNADSCTYKASSGVYGIFPGCTALKTVYIGDNVKLIPSYIFYNCTALTDLTIGNAVASIGNYTFYSTGLTKLVLPSTSTLVNIGNSAFYKCVGLTKLSLPSSLVTIGSNAFAGCSNIKDSLALGSSLKTIGGSAFSNCSAFTGSLVIPNSVKIIGGYSFAGCTGLSGLQFGSSLDSIGEYAFQNCTGLKDSLCIPNSVEYIGFSAFENCSGYTKISIGSSVTGISSLCFSGLSNLIKIYCLASTPPDAYSNLFGSSELEKAKIYAQATLYVPAAGYKLYSKMEPWKNFDMVAFDFSLQVIPSVNGAKFTWTPTSGAESYVLTIYADKSKTDTVCILTFNAYGQLTALALRSADTDAGGFSFTVSSLSSNKDYYCDMNVYNSSNQLLSSKSVTFQTSGTTSDLNDSKAESRKIFARNHTIVAEGVYSAIKVYNLSGCLIGSSIYEPNATQEINVPTSGIYVVRVDNKAQKVIVK